MADAFMPDYYNLEAAARNQAPARVPLYEHGIDWSIMEAVLGVPIAAGFQAPTLPELRHFFARHNDFYRHMGYDTVTWELGFCSVLPNAGALGAHQAGAIHGRDEFEQYPWDRLVDDYFQMWGRHFEALRLEMPEGMRAVGGIGNGVFEIVQDLVGYEKLCLMSLDDPELYADLFARVGDTLVAAWRRFFSEFGDVYAVCRFGDDLGFKSAPLLPPDDIRRHVIPQYQRIVELVHQAGKPFLLHSCGCIFDVMDDMIEVVKIDAKHSNEDAIAPFADWVARYGDRIGNFGGIDMDVLCRCNAEEVYRAMRDVVECTAGHGGTAYGSGNSIPKYVPAENYVAMCQAVRDFRGDGVIIEKILLPNR